MRRDAALVDTRVPDAEQCGDSYGSDDDLPDVQLVALVTILLPGSQGNVLVM